MLDEKIIEHHQAQLKFHRILYGLLILLVFIVYCWKISEASIVYLWILLITFILCGIETVFSKFVFFHPQKDLRCLYNPLHSVFRMYNR